MFGFHLCVCVSLGHFGFVSLVSFVGFWFFFSTEPRDWLGRMSPKLPILCQVEHQNHTQSLLSQW